MKSTSDCQETVITDWGKLQSVICDCVIEKSTEDNPIISWLRTNALSGMLFVKCLSYLLYRNRGTLRPDGLMAEIRAVDVFMGPEWLQSWRWELWYQHKTVWKYGVKIAHKRQANSCRPEYTVIRVIYLKWLLFSRFLIQMCEKKQHRNTWLEKVWWDDSVIFISPLLQTWIQWFKVIVWKLKHVTKGIECV